MKQQQIRQQQQQLQQQTQVQQLAHVSSLQDIAIDDADDGLNGIDHNKKRNYY